MSALTTVLASAPIVLAVAVVPGGAWVLAAGPGGRSRAENVGTALALSPGLYGGAVLLLLRTGLPLHSATAFALAGFALVAGVAAWARGRRRSGEAESPPDARATWVAAAVTAGLVALFPLLSEWWRVYSDAWNHVAIVRAVVAHGAHPLDPFFAGLRLQYPCIYHAQMASVSTATGGDVFVIMAIWGAFALAGLMLCAGPTVTRLHGRAQAMGLALLVLGLNAAFPLFAPLLAAKALIGEVRGWPELVRTFSVMPFGVFRATHLLQGLNGQDFFLNKFTVTTPFALGLAAYTAYTASLVRWLDRGERRELWIAAGAVLAAGLMHPVIVLDLLPATLGLAALTFAAPRSTGLSRGAVAAWTAAVVAGAIPVALYTSGIMGGEGGSHREFPIDVSLWKWIGLYSTLAFGLLLAVRPALAFVRARGPRRAWFVLLLLQLGIATVIRTPGGSSFFAIDKFSYLVWIPLALTGGAELSALLARRGPAARTALLLAFFLPVNGLAIAGRLCDPNARARQPWDMPGLVWMRSHLPADAVLVLPYGDPITGNYVGRDQYMCDDNLAELLGYPHSEIAARHALITHLFATDSLATGDASRLRRLRRPAYAVWTRFDDPRLAVTPRLGWSGFAGTQLPALRPHWEGRYPILYASESHVVAELTPAPAPVAVAPPGPAGTTALPR